MWLHVNRKCALLHAGVGTQRIHRALWGAGLTALLALAAAPAHALTCPAPHPAVQVDVHLATPVIDNTLSQPVLQQRAGKSYHGGHTMGLYYAVMHTRWRVLIREQSKGGLACRWIDGVVIEITEVPRTIYIVREGRPGSCVYDVVLAHERRHQAVDDGIVAEFRPRLRQAAERALAALPAPTPVPAGGAAAAQRRLTAPVDAALRRVLDVLDGVREARQAAIDSLGEYRRLGAACR